MTDSIPEALAIPEPQPLDGALSLEGQCAVVTGGSRGLGEAIVKRLAEAGASVVFTGRNAETLRPMEAAVAERGGTAVAVEADAARIADTRRVVDFAVEQFGRVDIMVNNAAVFQPSLSIETTEELWDKTHDVDLKGAFFACQAAAQAMIAAERGGRIINLLSTDAFRPSGMLAAYDAAKAGLATATLSLAKELAEHRILVNAVVPGSTITEERIAMMASGEFVSAQMPEDAPKTLEKMQAVGGGAGLAQALARVPLGRPGYPTEVADAVLFLSSGLSTYISGVCLTVDGAQSLR